jgi:alkylhydroperoxidase family enzyme
VTPSATAWSDRVTGAEALRRYAPAAAEVLERLIRTIASRPDWVALVRWSCATAQELTPLPLPRSVGPLPDAVRNGGWSALPEAEQTVLRAAEQFSVDVSGIDDDLRERLWSVLGEPPRVARGRLLAMMWLADLAPRVFATLDRLFAPGGAIEPAGAEDFADDATPLAHEFVRVVHTLHEVDPILSDVVRLRGAHAHNCRLCKSLRSRAALVAGATEDDFDGGGDYEHSTLPTASKAALALVDAMLWYPARIPDDVLDGVRANFTPAQAVEIVLDVMRNAWNKTTVAAQLDEAHVADGIEVYQYHDDGTVEFALTGPER